MLIFSVLVPVERPSWAPPFSVLRIVGTPGEFGGFCGCARSLLGRLVSLAWPTVQLQGNNLFTTGLREAESAICRRLCLRLLTPNSNAPFFSLILQQVPLSISIQKSQDRGDFEQPSRALFFWGLGRAIELAFERLRC